MRKNKKKIVQQKKEIKIILWLMAFVALLGLSNKLAIFEAKAIEEPRVVSWMFPEIAEKKMTDKEIIWATAHKECNKIGLGVDCINDLMGIAFKETKFKCNAVGDFGASHGCFQLHLGFHPEITQEQARNPEFATKWTIERLKHYGYPEKRSYSIRKHNGSPTNPKTEKYLNDVNLYAKK